ncbi:MAG: energy transducer TonB [Bacteroidales bacterium]|nr:energy transducer TonB [Bacteroidales bacterium]
MEQRKTESANLENKKGYFFEIGLAVTLLIFLGIFEMKSKVEKAEEYSGVQTAIEDEELIPITRQEDIVLPPPPPPKQTVSEILEILDDKVVVEDIAPIEELDDDAKVDFSAPVEEVVQEEEKPEEPEIFFIVEEMPQFPGGETALRKYIAENVRYPEMAKENDIQGTVYVRFVVDEKGKVTNVELLRGVDPLLDKEALRVVNSLPNWKPGKQRGKAVKVSHSVPIKFALKN